MHNLHPSYIVPMSFSCFVILECVAVAALILARQYSRLRTWGSALLAFSSKAVWALPGLVLVALLAKNVSPMSLQPYMFAIGAPLSCVLLELCLHLE